MVALALATATGPVLGADPPCPSDWPAQGYAGELREADHGQNLFEGFHTDADNTRWYVFRSGNSNGSTTVRAYPESDDYPTGYVTDQPHQVCYLIVRESGATEDLDPPRQITFSKDSDDGANSGGNSVTVSSDSATPGTAGAPTQESSDGAETNVRNVNTVNAGECGDAARGSAGTPDRPDAPTLIPTQDNTMVGVGWTAPNDNGQKILGYSIMLTVVGGVSVNSDAGGLSEILDNLAANTVYEIRVSACNSVGFGPWSHGKELTTAGSTDPAGSNTVGDTNNNWCGVAEQGSAGTPSVPDAPTVTVNGEDSITVTWTAPSDNGGSSINMYAVQYTPAGGTATIVKVTTGTSHTLKGLVAGTDHQIQVAACNAVGMSPWSTSTSGLTEGTRPDPQITQRSDDNNGGGNNGGGGGGGNNGGGGGNGGGGNGGGGGGGADNGNGDTTTDDSNSNYVDSGTCPEGMWVGHSHRNARHWNGSDWCREGSWIDGEDDHDTGSGVQHHFMWTKTAFDPHWHRDENGNVIYTDEAHDGNSCNQTHIDLHPNDTFKPGCGP